MAEGENQSKSKRIPSTIISRVSFISAVILCVAILVITYHPPANVDMALLTQRLTVVALLCAVLGLWMAMESAVKTQKILRELKESIKAQASPEFDERIGGQAAETSPQDSQ